MCQFYRLQIWVQDQNKTVKAIGSRWLWTEHRGGGWGGYSLKTVCTSEQWIFYLWKRSHLNFYLKLILPWRRDRYLLGQELKGEYEEEKWKKNTTKTKTNPTLRMKWKVWPKPNALDSSVLTAFGTEPYRRFKDTFLVLLHHTIILARSRNVEISWERYFALLSNETAV